MTVLPDAVRALVDAASNAHAFLTHPGSRKTRNLQSDGRVVIALTAEDQPFTTAAIRGRIAEQLEGDAAWAVIDRIAIKYIGRQSAWAHSAA